MLREGLRQELPELFALWDGRPRLAVPRMHPIVAALAALGIQWLSLALIRGVVAVTYSLTEIAPVRAFEMTAVLSWAIATVVAYASAGRAGIALLIGIALAIDAMQIIARLPSLQLSCELSGGIDCPGDPGRLLLAQWPFAAGVVAGVLARRLVSPGPVGVLALGLGAAAVVLGGSLIDVIVAFAGPMPTWVRGAVIGIQVATALAMGWIVGRLGRRHVLNGLLIAAAYVVPWLPHMWSQLQQRGPIPIHFESFWLSLTPAFYAAAALVGLALGALLRRRALSPARPPRWPGRAG